MSRRRAAVAGLVLGLVLVGGTARAQTITIGVHGGVDMARVEADSTVDSAYVTQPLVGAEVAVGFAGPFALRLELDYARKGGQLRTGGPAGPTTDYTLGYLAIPVNLRYELGVGSTTAYVFAGATLGALLAAEERREGGSSQDIKDQLNAVDISLDLGFGLAYHLSPAVALLFDVRYCVGLNQIAKGDAVLDTSSWTSRAIQMVAGLSYTFGVGVGGPTAPLMPGFASPPP
jgi:hypothetical protein